MIKVLQLGFANYLMLNMKNNTYLDLKTFCKRTFTFNSSVKMCCSTPKYNLLKDRLKQPVIPITG